MSEESLFNRIQRMWEAAGHCPDTLTQTQAVLLLSAELLKHLPDILIALENSQKYQDLLLIKRENGCTCLTELEDDAYSPGGPMSGQAKPPPCEIHGEIKTNSPPQLKKFNWTPHSPPTKECPYDHSCADTPFGQLCIEWKSWKEHGGGYVIYFNSDFVSAQGSTLEEAQADAEKWYEQKIKESLVE